MVKRKQAKEFIFRGTVELSGVVFFVVAANEDEAKQKARDGDFVEYESNTAETINWSINPETIELNE